MRLRWARSAAGTAVAELLPHLQGRALLLALTPAEQSLNKRIRTARMRMSAAQKTCLYCQGFMLESDSCF